MGANRAVSDRSGNTINAECGMLNEEFENPCS
jgi:hypothetical protein